MDEFIKFFGENSFLKTEEIDENFWVKILIELIKKSDRNIVININIRGDK